MSAGIELKTGDMTLVSTGAQALTHTGDASAHFTLSSTNGNTIVESVVFDGSQMAGNTRKISTVSAGTASLTVAESGGVVVLDQAGGSTISLPDIDSTNINLYVHNCNRKYLWLYDQTGSDDTLLGGLTVVGTSAGQSIFASAGSSNSALTLISNDANSGGEPGTFITFTAYALNKWMVTGSVANTAANPTGASLFS